MKTYRITYDDTQRRAWRVNADGPEEALESFWLAYNAGELDDWETDSCAPQNVNVEEGR